jgi:hypothetical protein
MRRSTVLGKPRGRTLGEALTTMAGISLPTSQRAQVERASATRAGSELGGLRPQPQQQKPTSQSQWVGDVGTIGVGIQITRSNNLWHEI